MNRSLSAAPVASLEANSQPLRILITALGGEGGGTLMNWLVSAARSSGFGVQATSVPGVAQRTGATSYYLEIAAKDSPAVLNLLPMPGRVDIVLSSELVEAARVIEQGYVSPENTTLIASTSRTYAIAEKIHQDDGRYDTATIEHAAREMAKRTILLDLQQLASDNETFISATLFGAVAGSGALPWSASGSRRLLESNRGQAGSEKESRRRSSLAGFDAAVAAVNEMVDLSAAGSANRSANESANDSASESTNDSANDSANDATSVSLDVSVSASADGALKTPMIPSTSQYDPAGVPDTTPDIGTTTSLTELMSHASAVLESYQDREYADLYRQRMQTLLETTGSNPPVTDRTGLASPDEVLREAARRLANWMAYEDIARVADLKTRPSRYAEVRAECEAKDDQIVRITEYLKPRAEEIADILPVALGEKVMRRIEKGNSIPLVGLVLGKGRRIPSNAAWGYWLLRLTASMKRFRRRSLRFREEQKQIECWLDALYATLPDSPEFALCLAELPRVRKGYSDTLVRGLASYRTIFNAIVLPAIASGPDAAATSALRQAIEAAFEDEKHKELNETVVKFHPRNSFDSSGDSAYTHFGASQRPSTGHADA